MTQQASYKYVDPNSISVLRLVCYLKLKLGSGPEKSRLLLKIAVTSAKLWHLIPTVQTSLAAKTYFRDTQSPFIVHLCYDN